jgi:hypothetical protein
MISKAKPGSTQGMDRKIGHLSVRSVKQTNHPRMSSPRLRCCYCMPRNDNFTAREAKIVEMEVTKMAAEDVLLTQADRVPVAEGTYDGAYLLVTAGDNRTTIYKGSPAWRRQSVLDSKAFGERFNKRDYIQQIDISGAEARTVMRGLLKIISVLDALADS